MFGGGVNLTAQPFEELLERDGLRCELRRAVGCTCSTGASRVPLSDCAGCGGLGFAYPAGLRVQNVSILLLGRSKQTSERGAGPMGVPSVRATFPGQLQPQIGDQVWPAGELVEVQQLVRLAPEHKPADRVSLRASTSAGAPPPRPTARRPGLLLYPGIKTLIWCGYTDEDGTHEIPAAEYRLVEGANNTRIVLPSSLANTLDAVAVRYTAPVCYMVARALPLRRLSSVETSLPSCVELIGLERWALQRDAT